MGQSAHLAQLRKLDCATFTTSEASAWLDVERGHAAKILARLFADGHVVRLERGRWAFSDRATPFMLPEALTAPKPSYVSLFSALYHHGMIEQIPDVVFAATLAPTRRVYTPLGSVSLHQLAPSFFFGFEWHAPGVQLATCEKALLDVLYLHQTRSRLFRALPELELPRSFSVRRARAIVERIASTSRRTLVRERLDALLA